MGAEGGLQASASAGIQGALPGQGQWLVLKLAQGVLEEDTRRELGGCFLQRLGREPGPQLRAEGTRPDPGPSALGPKANPPPIGKTQFSRQRGVALGSPRSVCPAKMPPGSLEWHHRLPVPSPSRRSCVSPQQRQVPARGPQAVLSLNRQQVPNAAATGLWGTPLPLASPKRQASCADRASLSRHPPSRASCRHSPAPIHHP